MVDGRNQQQQGAAPVPAQREEEFTVSYETDYGPVTLTPKDIKNYFCKDATWAEVVLFLNLCKFQGLNPWLKEAYLVKYGSGKAEIITSWEVYLKRAEDHPAFDGYEDEPVYDEGGKLVAWKCAVFRKDRSRPLRRQADLSEYIKRTQGGEVTAMWRDKQKTMLRKVVISQGLREAFPKRCGGMYVAEEVMGGEQGHEAEPAKQDAPLGVLDRLADQAEAAAGDTEAAAEQAILIPMEEGKAG
jgi:phage recombination protein Bet